MIELKDLKNSGLVTIGEAPDVWKDKQRTVIVLGVARGGTSMVSGVLHHLGVFMGEGAGPPVFEDLRLSDAIESNSWEKVEVVLKDYFSRYQIWGYKRPVLIQAEKRPRSKLRNVILPHTWDKIPSTSENIIKLHNRLANPLYVIPFKDMVSVANRINLSSGTDFIQGMKNTLVGYEKILNFITEVSANAFLLSYEKALRNKMRFIEGLIDFCRITPSGLQINAASDFISPSPIDYLDKSRTNKSIGYLDEVKREEITGWARYLSGERTAEVVLIIDGLEVQRKRADLFRKDLLDNKIHPRGTCAFVFKGFQGSLLKDGSTVRVKVVDDVNDLKNSFFLFKQD